MFSHRTEGQKGTDGQSTHLLLPDGFLEKFEVSLFEPGLELHCWAHSDLEAGDRVKQSEIDSAWTKTADENSGAIKGGGWALPRPRISFSGDLADHACAERLPGSHKGRDVKGCPTHRPEQ